MTSRFLIVLALATVVGSPAGAGLNHWTTQGPFGGPVNTLVMDPKNPDVLYISRGSRVLKSLNGGQSWSSTDQRPPSTVLELVIDPENTSTLYAGTRNGLYKSLDAGDSWSLLSGGLPPGSRITALAANPGDPQKILAGVLAEGLFRSENGGASWTSIEEQLFGIKCLTFDPETPSTVYVGTSSGVMKSLDDGVSWAAAGSGMPNGGDLYIGTLRMDPRSGDLYASNYQRFYVSIDGAASWTFAGELMSFANVQDMVIGPGTPATLYVATNGGIFKGEDGGATWTMASHGLRFTGADDVQVLAIHPERPSILMAGSRLGLYRSTNASDSWDEVQVRPAAISAIQIAPGSAARGDSPTALYAFGRGIYRSIDGVNWADLRDRRPQRVYFNSFGLGVGADGRTALHAAADSAVYRSLDEGASWEPRAQQLLVSTSVFNLKVAPSNPSIIYALTLGQRTTGAFGINGIVRSDDAGDSWEHVNPWFMQSLTIDPQDPRILYAIDLDDGVVKSSDAGASFTISGLGPTQETGVADVTVAPSDTSIVFAYGEGGLWKSADAGGSWHAISGGWPEQTDFATVAVDPGDASIVYAGTDRGFYRSRDGGDSWFDLSAGLSGQTVSSLAIHPDNPAILIAGTGNGVKTLVQVDPEDDSLLVVNSDRFVVEVLWRDFQGHSGEGRVVPFRSRDSGLFWFFSPDNWEILVKVLNGCDINDHYWVFAAATTNVAYTLQVTDSMTGTVRRYSNLPGVAAAAITDDTAFTTCGTRE